MTTPYSQSDVIAGQHVYNPFVLKMYDFLVLNISNSYIWNCPSKYLLNNFDQNMSQYHLDAGVGTGYFIEKSNATCQLRRLGLLDLNVNSLQTAYERIRRVVDFDPVCFQEDVLHCKPLDTMSFDSLSLNYLFHCLPGSIEQKCASVLEHIRPSLSPSANVFGATILGKGVKLGGVAKQLMGVYNKKKIFFNENDSVKGLSDALNTYCVDVEIELRGCVALFSARLS